MKKRLFVILAVLALLISCVTFVVSADNEPSGDAVTTPVAFDETTDKCPCCDKIVTNWTELPAISETATGNKNLSAGHYVVESNMMIPAGYYYNVTGPKKVVILFKATVVGYDGKNVFRFGLTGTNAGECQGYFLGGAGGKITGTGATSASATTNGSLMRIGGYGKLTIDGALTVELSDTVTSGGKGGLFDVIGGEVIMNDGTLNGPTSSSNVETYGAVILRYNSTTKAKGRFTMNGGTINGGTVTLGGAVYVVDGDAVIQGDAQINCAGKTVTSGGAVYVAAGTLGVSGEAQITGGIAEKGGAIYLAADAAFTMTGGTVYGCTITDDTTTVVNGGAIYSVATGTDKVQLNGGTINGGTIARAANSGKNITALKGRGGAIYLDGGTVNLGGVNIVGGKAQEGGCIYVNAGTVNMTAGSMSGGDSLGNGGTVFLKGAMNMSGGTVTANPQNTYAYSRGIRVANGKLNLSGNACVISDGTAEGNGVYVVTTTATGLAKVSLDGNAQVINPDGTYVKNNIYISNWGPDSSTRYPAAIEVKNTFTGAASVKFAYLYSAGYGLTGEVYSVGMPVHADFATSNGDFSGQLRMEIAEGNPNLWWDGATGLRCSDVQLCKKIDGLNVITWEKNNNAAVMAYNGGYIKLLNDEPIDLQGKEVYVDFNGNASQVTLSGGKLYGLDNTATAAKAGTSRITVADGMPELYACNPVTGQHIITLPEDDAYTFHTVDAGIRSVSLRPGVAGIYYSADFTCDEILKPFVDSFGVALSLHGIPGADFESDTKVLYTASDKADLDNGSFNSVLVKDIMKQQAAATNKANAELPIYASAYMKLTINGRNYTMMAENTANLSLKDVMQQIDKLWHSLDQKTQDTLIAKLYDLYIAEFAQNDWNLQNLEAEKLGLDENRELKVLTIGNSLSVDAGRMLAYVAQQEGSVGIKVGTLYKANCSVQEHADFLSNDKPNYWYYESGFDAENAGTLTSGSLVPSETKAYVGYNALIAEDWDVIVMQHSVFGAGQPETYDDSITTIIDYVNTHKTNPNAILVWNMTWMPPVDDELLATAEVEGRSPGFGKSYSLYTKSPLDREAQTMMYNMISGAVKKKIHTDGRFAYVLPSATMMQNALTATSDKVMYRDYIHGSDYGRLMNAYLWYSMLTGKTITEPAVKQIPGALRFASANRGEDLVLTQRMQDILVESVSNAIRNPFDATVSQYQKEESLKVLAIGNSFSQDAMWHLEEIARSEGYANVKLGTLYIGGSSLETNWTKADGDLADYQYYYNYDGNWKDSGAYNTSISQALAEQDWDIVTLQQSSASSGKVSTYEPYMADLVEYVQTNAPDAEILWHMTWAYAQDSTHANFPDYNSDQVTMYNAIVDATQNAVVPYVTVGDIAGIIPCGTTIQNARTSFMGDAFDRDGHHMNLMGRIVTATTWYSVLTGQTPEALSAFYFDDHFVSGKPNVTLTTAQREMIVEAVSNAIAEPWQVTAFAD